MNYIKQGGVTDGVIWSRIMYTTGLLGLVLFLSVPIAIQAQSVVYNGEVDGFLGLDESGGVNGSTSGTYDTTLSATVTGGVEGQWGSFEGTIAGDITGDVTGEVNYNGFDTLFMEITNSSSSDNVHVYLIGYFAGAKGEYVADFVTTEEPLDFATELTVNGPTEVVVGDSVQFDASLNGYKDAVAWKVWTDGSSNAGSSTINEDNGTLTAITPGQVTVIASALDGSLLTENHAVEIVPKPVTQLALVPSDGLTVTEGEQLHFVVQAQNEDGDPTDVPDTTSFTITDNSETGSFSGGTVGGECSDTSVPDQIASGKGQKALCYSNSTPGEYTLVLDAGEYGASSSTIVVEEYVDPMFIDANDNGVQDEGETGYDTLTAALDAAGAGATILVRPGTHSIEDVITKPVTLQATAPGVMLEGKLGSTALAPLAIGSDNVTIDGFTITNQNQGGAGIYIASRSNVTIKNNHITNIGSSENDVYGRGILVVTETAPMDNIVITDNELSHITSGAKTQGSEKNTTAIQIAGASTNNLITGLRIEGNTIHDINAATSAEGGQIAYGIWFDAASKDTATGTVESAIVRDNQLYDITGRQARAIGLHGATKGALLSSNEISDITGTADAADAAVGVHIANNRESTTVQITENKFLDPEMMALVREEGSEEMVIIYGGDLESYDEGLYPVYPLDAEANWWGTAVGEEIQAKIEGVVDYTPWYLDASMQTLSSVALGRILADVSLFGEPTLVSVAASGTATSTPVVQLLEDQTVTAPALEGEAEVTVTIEAGTEIRRSDGQPFAISDLSMNASATTTVAGKSETAHGVLQFGLADYGLVFDQSVTISIPVGSDKNGETLDIFRSVSGQSGWTQTGIVDPASCVVSEGLCTFSATQASYYGAYEQSEVVSSSRSPSGSYMPRIEEDTPTPSGQVAGIATDREAVDRDTYLQIINEILAEISAGLGNGSLTIAEAYELLVQLEVLLEAIQNMPPSVR